MVTNNPQNRQRDTDREARDQERPEGRPQNEGRERPGHEEPRSGHDILHEAAEQTAQAVSDALSEAAQMGAQRLTHAAQGMVEELDLGDVAQRTKHFARSNPMQLVVLGIATAVLVGLLIQATRSGRGA